MIRNKTIKFNLEKNVDRELWEKLQSLPHGMFSEATKTYWLSFFNGGFGSCCDNPVIVGNRCMSCEKKVW